MSARQAIVDIGSNSLRLVIYDGLGRAPGIAYNEKVAIGLGRGLVETGEIGADAFAAAVTTCARFAQVLKAAGIGRARTVATAAARDATNGAALLSEIRRTGLAPELLDGEAEALGSAMGVLSAFPWAQGVVGDVGGGSLELVALDGGEASRAASFPLGTLRLPPLRTPRGLDRKRIAKLLRKVGWGKGAGPVYYSVGGTGRALGALDLHLLGASRRVIHGHAIPVERLPLLRKAALKMDPDVLKRIPGVSSSRVPMLADMAALLIVLAKTLDLATIVISGYGLREGLLFQKLSRRQQLLDPLIESARALHDHGGAAGWDGDVVARWIAPLFAGDPHDERIRHAACLLSGLRGELESTARARSAAKLAFDGAWVGIDAGGCAELAQALFTAWGGKGRFAADGAGGAPIAWGEAIRLAMRLSAGHSAVLSRAVVARAGDKVILTLRPADAPLYGELVRKQHRALAAALGAEAVAELG